MEVPVGQAGKTSVWQALIFSSELWEEVWTGDVNLGVPGTEMVKPWAGLRPWGCGARYRESRELKRDAKGRRHIIGSRARADHEGFWKKLPES